ncbi:hypothetical protein [Ornithinibacillus halophilus]|uniref:ABC-2 type transport system permease protein n=1 Tax=Ornithinibacillus halophilus TaxID=930117 RepID=A0A1M5MPG4_9BACI|nr:hypothetical protein [Ornithinibacillus halophilus]SHG79136.1 hypothetical protein SAMN05216225_106220 [Ornithinibacillus halophilus]
MNRQIKGLLYFFVTDIRHSLIVFWSILLLTLVVSLAFSYFLLSVEDGKLWFAIPFGTYFYCMIMGFITVKESIPFSIKMGATRKNLYFAIAIFFFVFALFKALLSNIVHSSVIFFKDVASIDTFNFIHPSLAVQDTWLTRFTIDTLIMFTLLSVMFLLGLVFHKFGLIGGGAVVGLFAISLLIGIAKGWLFEFLSDMVRTADMVLFYQIFGVGLLFYALSFLLLRRITIHKVR